MSFLSAIPLLGSLFDSIGDAIDKNITTEEERMKLHYEMMALSGPVIQAIVLAQAEFDRIQQQVRLMEIQSGDRFIRWTRPAMSWLTFIFWGYCVFTGNPNAEYAFWAFGLIAGLFSATRGGEKIITKWTNKWTNGG